MKTHDKAATAIFWAVIVLVGLFVAGNFLLTGIPMRDAGRIIGALTIIVLVVFGLRECARLLKDDEDGGNGDNAV